MAYRRQRCVTHDRSRLPPAAPRAYKNRLTTLERTPNNDKSEERQEPTRSPFPMFLGARSLASAGWSEFFFFLFSLGEEGERASVFCIWSVLVAIQVSIVHVCTSVSHFVGWLYAYRPARQPTKPSVTSKKGLRLHPYSVATAIVKARN